MRAGRGTIEANMREEEARSNAIRASGTDSSDPGHAHSKRIPKCFLGQVFFWRPGVPRPKNYTISGNWWCFCLAAHGGKANKPLVPGRCVFFCPWCPRSPKNTWPKNNFGLPFKQMRAGRGTIEAKMKEEEARSNAVRASGTDSSDPGHAYNPNFACI